MDHEATIVLEHARAERLPSPEVENRPERFVDQLTALYVDAEHQPPSTEPLEIVTPPCVLRKPGWFRKG